MTLKERLMSEPKSTLGKNCKEYFESEEGKNYDKFLDICNRLEKYIINENVSYGTYAEVFGAIEKRNIDISDIVPKNEYNKFKERMLSDDVQVCLTVGKQREPKYDLTKEEDRIKYMNEHGFGQF